MSQVPSDVPQANPADWGNPDVMAAGVAIMLGAPAIAGVLGEGLMGVGQLTNSAKIFGAGISLYNAATTTNTATVTLEDEISGAVDDAQSLIDDIVQNELKNVELHQYPQYDPNLDPDTYGEAMRDTYTKIGPLSINEGRPETGITILHEEMHHRLWERMWAQSEKYVEDVAQRFWQMIGK